MSDDNVYKLPVNSYTPQAVVEALDQIVDDIGCVAVVVAFKEDIDKDYAGTSAILSSKMSNQEVTWLRYVVERGFVPSA